MEKLIKMNAVEFEGYAVTVTVEGGIEEYAKAFLDIESKEELTEYLENFGNIKRTEKVLMYQLQETDWDFDKYDEAVIVPYFE